MIDIEVGDIIVCIDDDPAEDGTPCPYVLDQLYTVLELHVSNHLGVPYPDGGVGVDTYEFCDPQWCWDITCFKKVYRPKQEFLNSLLTKTPEMA